MGNPTSLGIKGSASPLAARMNEITPEDALDTVKSLSVQLRGKSGVLQVVHADNAAKDVKFERKGWWQFRARSDDNKTRTADTLRALVNRAGLDSGPLETYLMEHGGRAGTRKLSEVLNDLVNKAEASKQEPAQAPNDAVEARGSLLGHGAEVQELAPNEVQRSQAPEVADDRREVFEQLKMALSRGHYAEAARTMNAREPLPSPAEMARELVTDHYGGKALSTRLVQFAVQAFSGADRTAQAAEFLLAAHNIPNPAPNDFDVSQLKPLVDALRLWQASGQDDVDKLAHDLTTQVDARLPDLVAAKAQTANLFKSGQAHRIDLTQLLDQIETVEKKVKQEIVENLGYDPSNIRSRKRRDSQELEDAIQTIEDAKKQARSALMKKVLEPIILGEIGYVSIIGDPEVRSENSGFDALTKYLADSEKVLSPDQGISLAGCSVRIDTNCPIAIDSSHLTIIGDCHLKNVRLRNCVLEGRVASLYLRDADLTGSEFHLDVSERLFTMNANFTGAKLEGADVMIDYSSLHTQKSVLSVMNPTGAHAYTTSGPLSAIMTIDNRYISLKQKLMREALQVCEKYGVVNQLKKSWSEELMESPVYLADPEIRRLAEPLIGSAAQ